MSEKRGKQSYEEACLKAAYSLGKIGRGNETAINKLVELIGNSLNKDIRWQAVESLGKIGHGNDTAINALVEFIANSQDEDILLQAVESLEKIGHGNDIAINGLVELIANSLDGRIRSRATYSLKKIGKKTAINALIELIINSKSKLTRKFAAESLETIDPGNEFAAFTLLNFPVNWTTGKHKIKSPKLQVKSRSSIPVSQKPGIWKKPVFSTVLLVLGVSLLFLLIFFYHKQIKAPEIQQQKIPAPRASPSLKH